MDIQTVHKGSLGIADRAAAKARGALTLLPFALALTRLAQSVHSLAAYRYT
jgi:hypothetical protein